MLKNGRKKSANLYLLSSSALRSHAKQNLAKSSGNIFTLSTVCFLNLGNLNILVTPHQNNYGN
jgi:hypothetical protein